MMVSILCMITGGLLTAATIFRIRRVSPAGGIRSAERQLLVITSVMMLSLTGQCLVALSFYFFMFMPWFSESIVSALFTIQPFTIDLTYLSPPWIMHFMNPNFAKSKSDNKYRQHSTLKGNLERAQRRNMTK
ncbi:hypothetical protein WR25_15168 [Diploscapter pachys]|uniref:Serpentine receptor class gamma n=1 Tax=Diploscapter pachys TaxID=2018661 RepID=A0A2A2KP23_9BILA|nr:hypothetical protein WR25_15168 [Diploscapter pachys]